MDNAEKSSILLKNKKNLKINLQLPNHAYSCLAQGELFDIHLWCGSKPQDTSIVLPLVFIIDFYVKWIKIC